MPHETPMNLKQIKNLPGARKTSIPEFVPPQLATLTDKPPSGEEWFHELKFDGYRLLCHLEGRQVRFWTRNRKDWTAKFASVGKAVKALPLKSAILDGEIVALDPSGRPSFQRLQQSINQGAAAGLIFNVFDLIYVEGFNITRNEILIDGKQAIAVDGLPAQDPWREVFIVDNNHLYILFFEPWAPTAEWFPELEKLYSSVIVSFHVMARIARQFVP